MEPNKAKKSTSDLVTELGDGRDLTNFLKANESEFINPDVGSLILDILDKKGLTKAELARNSGMSSVYLYQLLGGRRSPSRDRMICLCIGLRCTPDEAQELLRQSRFAALYPKVRRDAIICFGLERGMDINKINDLLYENEEETLI